ncbi:SAM-dependent methyltransferase [Natronospira proteinivora]|uniref:SAM-dependent methyltransferase n=1 Tax=Natronospira proteinivora TaxID=1807133 RepID=A0ABT1G4C6_9GAMM|nr:SAM-dependent methyltransferase [Natronospira proteinivora]
MFARLPERACILDVCAGNGAVALLAAEYSEQHGRGFEIHAVDRSPLPLEQLSANTFNLMGEVSVESLPFETASFDLVTSQFGLEYTEAERSVAEVRRVLRPNGMLAAVHHDPDSQVIRTARSELGLLRYFDGDDGGFELAAQLLRRLSDFQRRSGSKQLAIRALQEDREASRLRERLNDTVAQAKEALRQPSFHVAAPLCAEILDKLQRILQEMATRPADHLLASLESVRTEYRGSRHRLDDLLACQMVPGGFALSQRFQDAGVHCAERGALREEVGGEQVYLGRFWYGNVA